ncbi:MAG TPA: hypothetical protein VLA77_02895 [Candidatus Saccharimonadales bacterium]|nr:hypothetical protein [Candidatus Saccharimonadales bacterium]
MQNNEQNNDNSPIKLHGLDLSTKPGLNLSNKSESKLSVVLMGAIILFGLSLIAGGLFAYFYFFAPDPEELPAVVDPRNSTTVDKVEWIAPQIPANYVIQNQKTDTSDIFVYQDDASGCKVTTKVEPVTQNKENSGQPYYVRDIDAVHEYEFGSEPVSQDVGASGVDISKLEGVNIYKQFNYQLASVSYVCKSVVLDAKKAELEEFIKQFMVKTERAT